MIILKSNVNHSNFKMFFFTLNQNRKSKAFNKSKCGASGNFEKNANIR